MESGNYAKEQKKEEDLFNEADHIIKVANNKKPVFENIDITGMTATSATIKAKATDGDGENLTYILYMGTSEDSLEEKDKKENIEQGQEVELIGEGIDTTNLIYYRVDVLDKYSKVESQVSTLQNKKPAIGKAEVTDITRTTAVVKIQGTDEDREDKLTYRIYYGTDKNALETTGKVVQKENIVSGTEEPFNIAELQSGIKYFYKIAITDGKQTVHTEGEFTTVANNAPKITPTITRDITVNESDPTKSTSWIQVAAEVTDADNDKLDIKIYLGTVAEENLGEEDLLDSINNAESRNNINKEKR